MPDVVVVGAGMAGLVCAADLSAAGLEVQVIEAGDAIGGRLRTDRLDGFLLDRGFQILLTAYPQVRQRIDIDRLRLGRFAPGATVRTEDGDRRLADPLRRPQDLLATLNSSFSGRDALKAAALVADVRLTSPRALLRRPDVSTAERLARAGFSDRFIRLFWRPFFAGIQLDPDLEVSSRRFDIVLRMLAGGATGLPAEGIAAVAAQIAEGIPADAIRLNARVSEIAPGSVSLAGGEQVRAPVVVVATDGPTASQLLNGLVPDPGSRPVAACWYSLPHLPHRGGFLMLDGLSDGPARNLAPISAVQPTYAPPGRSLIVAAVPGPQATQPGLPARVSAQVADWLDVSPSELDLLRCDVIAHGQPLQTPPLAVRRRVDLGNGVFVCGDHRDTASLQGAMFSGERTAGSVLAHLHGQRSGDRSDPRAAGLAP